MISRSEPNEVRRVFFFNFQIIICRGAKRKERGEEKIKSEGEKVVKGQKEGGDLSVQREWRD